MCIGYIMMYRIESLQTSYFLPEESKLEVVSLCAVASESASFSNSSKIAESCTLNNNPPRVKKNA